MSPIECISAGGKTLAYVVRREASSDKTSFITPDEQLFQLGFVVYPKNATLPRHDHKPLQRAITGTSEVIMVRSGSCEVDIYDENRKLAASLKLRSGDLVMFAAGGHGFRMLEDCVLFEIKQGPYTGQDEKDRF